MPILSIEDRGIQQQCIVCENVRQVPFAELALVDDGGGGPIIAVPACAECSSVEYLLVSSDDAPAHPLPGSYGHLHSLLVNHLYGELAADRGADETLLHRPTVEELAVWFPDGLGLANTEPTD